MVLVPVGELSRLSSIQSRDFAGMARCRVGHPRWCSFRLSCFHDFEGTAGTATGCWVIMISEDFRTGLRLL